MRRGRGTGTIVARTKEDGVEAAEWDARYAERDLVWSAGPNVFVERYAADLRDLSGAEYEAAERDAWERLQEALADALGEAALGL